MPTKKTNKLEQKIKKAVKFASIYAKSKGFKIEIYRDFQGIKKTPFNYPLEIYLGKGDTNAGSFSNNFYKKIAGFGINREGRFVHFFEPSTGERDYSKYQDKFSRHILSKVKDI